MNQPGKGNDPMATGSWASLAGKAFTYASKPTGPGLFEIDVTTE